MNMAGIPLFTYRFAVVLGGTLSLGTCRIWNGGLFTICMTIDENR
jgi:hypothetical protein